jgi:LysR family transcriptional activator of glutamate synthase operon
MKGGIPLEWHQIENFIAVAKHQHFTKAAKQQLVSQPALSRSIMKLEEELGVPLFIRDGKMVRLTRYGDMFLEKAKQAQACIYEGIEEIQAKTLPDSGEISVAFLHTLGAHLIPQLIADYKKIYPNVSFQLYQGANDYLLHQVELGLADMCLTSPPVAKGRIEWTTLKKEPLYLVVPENHRLAGCSSALFQQLQEEEFISFKEGYGLRYIFDQMCSDLQIQPKITFEGEEAATIAGFVAAGLGIAILPKTKEMSDSSLRFLTIMDYPCERTIALASLSDSFLSPVAKRFKSFVIDYFQSLHSAL